MSGIGKQCKRGKYRNSMWERKISNGVAQKQGTG